MACDLKDKSLRKTIPETIFFLGISEYSFYFLTYIFLLEFFLDNISVYCPSSNKCHSLLKVFCGFQKKKKKI